MPLTIVAASAAEAALVGLKVVSDSARQGFPRYRFSAERGQEGTPPARLVAGSPRAARVLGKLAAAWVEAAVR